MTSSKYSRLEDDVSVDVSRVDLEPTVLSRSWVRNRRRFVLSLACLLALLLVFFSCTSPRTEPRPYNPLPSKYDTSFNSSSLPVVLWHGMGDSCCATWSIGALQEQIQQSLPGQTSACPRNSVCNWLPTLTAEHGSQCCITCLV